MALGSFFPGESGYDFTEGTSPKDKEIENKLYFAPWTSIESVQVILEGTREHEIHLLILSRKTMYKKPINPLVQTKKLFQ